MRLKILEPISICRITVSGKVYDNAVGEIGNYFVMPDKENCTRCTTVLHKSNNIKTAMCLSQIYNDIITIRLKKFNNIVSSFDSDQVIILIKRVEKFNKISIYLYFDIEDVFNKDDDSVMVIKSSDVKCERDFVKWYPTLVEVTFNCTSNANTLIYNNVSIIIKNDYLYYQNVSMRREAIKEVYNNVYEVAAPHDSDTDYLSRDMYSVLTDADVATCFKLKNHACVKFPTTIEFRTSEWKRLKSLKVIVGDVSYISDIELNISLLAVNGIYESDSLTTRWINVMNSCLKYLVYEKIINKRGY